MLNTLKMTIVREEGVKIGPKRIMWLMDATYITIILKNYCLVVKSIFILKFSKTVKINLKEGQRAFASWGQGHLMFMFIYLR